MDTVYLITHLNLRMESRLVGYAPNQGEAYKAVCNLGDQYLQSLKETLSALEGYPTPITVETSTQDPHGYPEVSVYHIYDRDDGSRRRHHTFIATPLKKFVLK